MRTIGFFVVLLAVTLGGTCVNLPDGTIRTSLEHAGKKRTYLVHVPPTYTGEQTVPLVIALHPFSLTGGAMETKSGFDAVADANDLIVCYPDAVLRVWNGDPTDEAGAPGEDDVGFINALIDQLIADYNIDAGRVYVAGMSNGALMSYRVACALSDRVAGIAGVVCTLPEGFEDHCAPAQPVPVLLMLGVADPYFPWEGGIVQQGPFMQTPYQSAAATVQHWVGVNNAVPTPVVEELPDTDPTDGTRVYRETHAANPGGAPVVLYRIEGGGHTWPGGATSLLEQWAGVGVTSRDVNAAEVIWDFFQSAGPI